MIQIQMVDPVFPKLDLGRPIEWHDIPRDRAYSWDRIQPIAATERSGQCYCCDDGQTLTPSTGVFTDLLRCEMDAPVWVCLEDLPGAPGANGPFSRFTPELQAELKARRYLRDAQAQAQAFERFVQLNAEPLAALAAEQPPLEPQAVEELVTAMDRLVRDLDIKIPVAPQPGADGAPATSHGGTPASSAPRAADAWLAKHCGTEPQAVVAMAYFLRGIVYGPKFLQERVANATTTRQRERA